MGNRIRTIYPYYLIILINIAFLLYVQWNTWGSLIVDTGRELWIPYQLSQGKALYKDIYYMYGLLPAYPISYLIKLFGVHLYVYILFGAATVLSCTILLHEISCFFTNRGVSTLVALFFLYIYAFRIHPFFNYILPYSFNSTFFIMFIQFTIYCILCYLNKKANMYLYVSILSISIAFLSRIEITFVVWAVILLASLYSYKTKQLRSLAYFIIPPILASVIYTLYFYNTGSFQKYYHDVRISSTGYLQILYSYVYHVISVVLIMLIGKSSNKYIKGIKIVIALICGIVMYKMFIFSCMAYLSLVFFH